MSNALVKKINVLIVPAGSGMAIGAIKSLIKGRNVNVVAADADSLAPGLHLAHSSYLMSRFSENTFWQDLKKIITRERIDIVIPALDPLLIQFSQAATFFQEQRVKVLISSPETIAITRDKWKTYRALKDKVPMPQSFIEKDALTIPYPVFIKPRDGSGSHHAFKIDSKKDLDYYWEKVPNPMVQEYLPGKEYTVDCLADMSGNLLLCVPRTRLDTKAGMSVKGQIVKDKRIDDIAQKIAAHISFCGPFFFQLKEKGRELKLIEINARISGGMPLSVASGPNVYLLAIKLFLGKKISIPPVRYGLYFTRFYEEIYITENQLNENIKKI